MDIFQYYFIVLWSKSRSLLSSSCTEAKITNGQGWERWARNKSGVWTVGKNCYWRIFIIVISIIIKSIIIPITMIIMISLSISRWWEPPHLSLTNKLQTKIICELSKNHLADKGGGEGVIDNAMGNESKQTSFGYNSVKFYDIVLQKSIHSVIVKSKSKK